ncbi:hypothetical protein ACFQI7_05150 [Paenibacillus allorhizosphaerae]|uniref:LysM domain-containing protein n=1 Tax=Paenibacillus allorhizosphaerae TaxID=2849866 RepID=A0ABM8VBV3_9BACL|nr:hypothetical protein [Paenibacillus allorhizosphaerae]CAG7622142.1 hypothetical protein PAECIP111802_00794 [Paenibacillus allorhizosphaerae]
MKLNKTYAKKVIVTTLTLALVLGGGALYGSRQLVHAEPSDASVQSDVPGSDDAKEQSGKTNRLKEWFGKRGEKQKEAGNGDKKQAAPMKGMPIIEEAAAILGMDPEALRTALKDKTLAQLASEKNISEADLIAKLEAQRGKKIDEAVAAGKLTAEKAERIKQNMAGHLKFMVNHKFDGEGKHPMRSAKHRMMPAPDKLAGILGISEEELKTQLNSGKSLAEIAQSKGMTKEQLVSKIKDGMTPWIEKMVDLKHMKEEKPKK